MSEISTAYCESLAHDISILEKCHGNEACIKKEITRCTKMSKYVCDPNFDKGKSVNQLLKDKGITLQMIIATQHTDYTSFDSIVKADYIRAETKDGYPFIIYLDAKGHVKTEECVTEMTCLQEKRFVSESQLKAAYQICTPAVRGVALFTPNGITVGMYNQRMKMVEYHHAYLHIEEKEDEKTVEDEVAVAYPIIPLSEIIMNSEVITQRIHFVMEPLRNLIKERAVKTAKDILKEVDILPRNLKHFSDDFFTRLEKLQCSIEKLRDIYKENERFNCDCAEEAKCNCEAEKNKVMEMTRYNIAVRERYVNEMLALYAAVCSKMKILSSITDHLISARDILDTRYCDFDHTFVDHSAAWAVDFEKEE